jgi:hypothetical protein
MNIDELAEKLAGDIFDAEGEFPERKKPEKIASWSRIIKKAIEEHTANLQLKVEQPKRDGDWIDEWGACKVCGREIPDGHAEICDIYKMEQEITQALKERDEAFEKLKFENQDRTNRETVQEKSSPATSGQAFAPFEYLGSHSYQMAFEEEKELHQDTKNEVIKLESELTQLRSAVNELVKALDAMLKRDNWLSWHNQEHQNCNACNDNLNGHAALTLADNLPHRKQSPPPSASDGSTNR